MKYQRWIVFLGIVILVSVIALIFSLTYHVEKRASEGIKISSAIPENLKDQFEAFSKRTSEAPEEALPVTPTKLPVPVPEQTTLNEETVNPVLIQDAMGDPIASGRITIDSDSYIFANGIFSSTRPLKINTPISVESEGYFPRETTIAGASQTVIVLEYQCDFLIKTEMNNSNCPNVKLTIWQIGSPDRPIEANCDIYANRSAQRWSSGSVLRVDEGLPIMQSNSADQEASPLLSPYGDTTLQTGDQLFSLGYSCWLPDRYPSFIQNFSPKFINVYLPLTFNNSSRLRIWDTLTMASDINEPISNQNYEILEIQRNMDRGFYYYQFPQLPPNTPKKWEVNTDKNGEYSFKALPAALYYVQAEVGSSRSTILPLHPCCGGGILELAQSGNLYVSVLREGLSRKISGLTGIDKANVSIRSNNSHFSMGQVTNLTGMAIFQSIPFGEFDVTVDIGNKTIEQSVTVNEPNVILQVKITDWERYQISGTVYDQEDKQRVPNFPLSLRSQAMAGREYQATLTNEKGEFVFTDMLPGEYSITEGFMPSRIPQYILCSNVHSGEFLNEGMNNSIIALSVNQRIDNLKLEAKKVITTVFEGKVTYEDDTPAVNALLHVLVNIEGSESESSLVYTFPEHPETNKNGNFSIAIFCNSRFSQPSYNFLLTAEIGNKKPASWREEEVGVYTLDQEKFLPDWTGTCALTGKVGDRFSGLHIVLEKNGDKTLYGNIVPKEEDFSNFVLYAQQNSSMFEVPVNDQGLFEIKNLTSGLLHLFVHPGIPINPETPFGIKKIEKYLVKKFTITIPKESPQIYSEIELQKAGYVWGFVKNPNQECVSGVFVQLKNLDGSDVSCASAITDGNGFFIIGTLGIPFDQQYYIEFGSYTIRKRTGQFSPNQENMILNLD